MGISVLKKMTIFYLSVAGCLSFNLLTAHLIYVIGPVEYRAEYVRAMKIYEELNERFGGPEKESVELFPNVDSLRDLQDFYGEKGFMEAAKDLAVLIASRYKNSIKFIESSRRLVWEKSALVTYGSGCVVFESAVEILANLKGKKFIQAILGKLNAFDPVFLVDFDSKDYPLEDDFWAYIKTPYELLGQDMGVVRDVKDLSEIFNRVKIRDTSEIRSSQGVYSRCIRCLNSDCADSCREATCTCCWCGLFALICCCWCAG